MKVFLHSKDNLKNNILKYLIFLIPLYCYGIYKNGILLYNKGLIGFAGIFKLVYLTLIGLLVYGVVAIIFKKKIKFNFDLLNVFIVPLFMPFSINYLYYAGIFLLGLLIVNFMEKYFKINNAALFILTIVGISFLTSSLNYLNPAEELKMYSFNTFDLLIGRSVSALGTSSIIIGVIIMLFLSLKTIYKYQIALSSLIVYIILSLVFLDKNLILNGNLFLSLILIAPDSISTPVNEKIMVIYGIMAGILSFFLSKYLFFYNGGIIAILIMSVIWQIVCKIHKEVL